MNEPQQKHRNPPSRAVEWVISGLVGLASGFTGIATQARLEFHKKLLDYWKKTPSLAHKESEHAAALEHLTTERAAGRLSTWEYITQSHKQKDAFSAELNHFSKHCLGIEPEGPLGVFKGTWQRFNFMGNDTQTHILWGAVITTAVGAAGTMMFFNSLNVHNKLNKIMDKENEKA
jgi:hypothetical protein